MKRKKYLVIWREAASPPRTNRLIVCTQKTFQCAAAPGFPALFLPMPLLLSCDINHARVSASFCVRDRSQRRRLACSLRVNYVMLQFLACFRITVVYNRLFLVNASVDLLANNTCILLYVGVIRERKRSAVVAQLILPCFSIDGQPQNCLFLLGDRGPI